MNVNHSSDSPRGAKVFVTSAYEDAEPLGEFLQDAAQDKFKKHQLTDDPAAADLILFIENSRYHFDSFFGRLKNHPLVKRYPDKVFMYNPHDMPWFVLPGLYPSIPSRLFDARCMAGACYIETINPYVRCDFSVTPEFLFAFSGFPHSAPRREIVKLSHPRASIMASNQDMFSKDKPLSPQVRYADQLVNTKYNLCPKGVGTSSIRLFETMKAGRVPVIVSDDWVRPTGPVWDDFAVFVPEDQVARLPEILEAEEVHWERKAKLARQAWEEFFAPDTIFNYFTERLLHIKQAQGKLGPRLTMYHSAAFLKYGFRNLVIQRVKPVLKEMGLRK